MNALVGTGATVSLISEELVHSLGLRKLVKTCNESYKLANDEMVKVSQELRVKLVVGKQVFYQQLHLWGNKSYPLLLGLNFLDKIDSISIEHMQLVNNGETFQL